MGPLAAERERQAPTCLSPLEFGLVKFSKSEQRGEGRVRGEAFPPWPERERGFPPGLEGGKDGGAETPVLDLGSSLAPDEAKSRVRWGSVAPSLAGGEQPPPDPRVQGRGTLGGVVPPLVGLGGDLPLPEGRRAHRVGEVAPTAGEQGPASPPPISEEGHSEGGGGKDGGVVPPVPDLVETFPLTSKVRGSVGEAGPHRWLEGNRLPRSEGRRWGEPRGSGAPLSDSGLRPSPSGAGSGRARGSTAPPAMREKGTGVSPPWLRGGGRRGGPGVRPFLLFFPPPLHIFC